VVHLVAHADLEDREQVRRQAALQTVRRERAQRDGQQGRGAAEREEEAVGRHSGFASERSCVLEPAVYGLPRRWELEKLAGKIDVAPFLRADESPAERHIFIKKNNQIT